MQRRQFIAGAAGLIASSLAPRLAMGDVPTPFAFDMAPPMDNRDKFIAWGVAQRGEEPSFLGERFDRFGVMVRNEDLSNDRNKHAFLLTPREEFVLKQNLGPRLRPRVSRHRLRRHDLGPAYRRPDDVEHRREARREGARNRHRLRLPIRLSRPPDRSSLHDRDHQAAGRAHARRFTISSIKDGYKEFEVIKSKDADGYYGWEEAAPFDKIIVTCGIDHVPPPLLQQLKPGGIMVIPVGPPGAQRVLKVVKTQAADGEMTVARSDIYGGRSCLSFPSPSSKATRSSARTTTSARLTQARFGLDGDLS